MAESDENAFKPRVDGSKPSFEGDEKPKRPLIIDGNEYVALPPRVLSVAAQTYSQHLLKIVIMLSD